MCAFSNNRWIFQFLLLCARFSLCVKGFHYYLFVRFHSFIHWFVHSFDVRRRRRLLIEYTHIKPNFEVKIVLADNLIESNKRKQIPKRMDTQTRRRAECVYLCAPLNPCIRLLTKPSKRVPQNQLIPYRCNRTWTLVWFGLVRYVPKSQCQRKNVVMYLWIRPSQFKVDSNMKSLAWRFCWL